MEIWGLLEHVFWMVALPISRTSSVPTNEKSRGVNFQVEKSDRKNQRVLTVTIIHALLCVFPTGNIDTVIVEWWWCVLLKNSISNKLWLFENPDLDDSFSEEHAL